MSSSPNQSGARAPFASLPLFAGNSGVSPLPGSLNDDSLVRGVITASIKRSGKSRDQIADAMALLLGVPVTARMITSFTAESKELHRWPGAWDRAFCFATGDDALLRCRIELAGFLVITKEESSLLDLGRQYLLRKRSEESIAMLERSLSGVEL